MFADITEEGLEKDGVLVEIDDAEWTEREDMRAVAEGGDDSPLNSNVQVDKDVMFVRYVPRMKQPEEERPLDIDLTNPPSVLELSRAGLNPGGWTQEYYKLLLTHVPERAFNCPRSCTLCGKNTYYACKTCKVASGRSTGKPLPLCFPSVRKQSGSSSSTKIKEYNCHALYHLPESVGKGRCDCQTFEKMSTWDTTRDKRLKEIERAAMQKVAHYSRDEILKVL
jgi:hypothetical protein